MIKHCSLSEFKSWIASSVKVRCEGDDICSNASDSTSLRMKFPAEARRYMYLSSALLNWVDTTEECAVWISNWENYTDAQGAVFESVRYGVDEKRAIVDAPALTLSHSTEGDEASAEREASIVSGMIFMMMSFDWECYIINKETGRFVQIQDEFIYFTANDPQAVEGAKLLMKEYGSH